MSRAVLPPRCDHVAIVALGDSVNSYLSLTKRMGGRWALADQVWAINALGGVLDCDLIFHMDDVRVQEIRAEAMPGSNIEAMLQWLRKHPGPIMTSRAVEGYPGLVEFPLEEVLAEFGNVYFNSTVAYAVAYAVWLGVKKISLFGCDFTYPNLHQAEQGRGCVEFWLGRATERGIEIGLPQSTTLMDAGMNGGRVLYGYDAVNVEITDGKVTFTEKELPTASEIEAAYNHSPKETRR